MVWFLLVGIIDMATIAREIETKLQLLPYHYGYEYKFGVFKGWSSTQRDIVISDVMTKYLPAYIVHCSCLVLLLHK